MIIKKKRK